MVQRISVVDQSPKCCENFATENVETCLTFTTRCMIHRLNCIWGGHQQHWGWSCNPKPSHSISCEIHAGVLLDHCRRFESITGSDFIAFSIRGFLGVTSSSTTPHTTNITSSKGTDTRHAHRSTFLSTCNPLDHCRDRIPYEALRGQWYGRTSSSACNRTPFQM